MSSKAKPAPLPVEEWPLEKIVPYERNARDCPESAVSKVAASIREFGWRQPIVVDEAGVIVAGHTRLLAARRLGLASAPVHVVTGLSPEKVRALRLADNRTRDETTWNEELLAEELRELGGAELAAAGFDLDEIANLLAPGTPEPEPGDDVEPEVAIPVTQPGDLWLLGEHRVKCGDATDPDDVAQACDGQTAACVFTDPPYGISYEAISGKHDALAGDELRSDDLVRSLLEPALRLAAQHTTDAAAFYIWHAFATQEEFAFAARAAGLDPRQVIIWVKPRALLAWADYHWQHEPCLYASKAGEAIAYYGDRRESTVWKVTAGERDGIATIIEPGVVLTDSHGRKLYCSTNPPKRRLREIRLPDGATAQLYEESQAGDVWHVGWDTNTPDHPTQKPIGLAVRALANSTLPGELVLDPFLGSGSTLLGAEAAGRIAAGTELDPHYVDVTVRRWQDATGAQATRESDGATFDQAAAEAGSS